MASTAVSSVSRNANGAGRHISDSLIATKTRSNHKSVVGALL